MGELTQRVQNAHDEVMTALAEMRSIATMVDHAKVAVKDIQAARERNATIEELQAQLANLRPTVVDVSPERWVITAGSGGCQINGLPTGGTTLNEGDIYALHRNDENLVALRTSLSECIRQRDEVRIKNAYLNEACDQKDAVIENLQEFNANQRRQLESLQKEMAAIHMCVIADSRTKLDDAVHQHGREMPFLLKAVYEVMVRYLSTEYNLRRLQALVDKFIKETK